MNVQIELSKDSQKSIAAYRAKLAEGSPFMNEASTTEVANYLIVTATKNLFMEMCDFQIKGKKKSKWL